VEASDLRQNLMSQGLGWIAEDMLQKLVFQALMIKEAWVTDAKEGKHFGNDAGEGYLMLLQRPLQQRLLHVPGQLHQHQVDVPQVGGTVEAFQPEIAASPHSIYQD